MRMPIAITVRERDNRQGGKGLLQELFCCGGSATVMPKLEHSQGRELGENGKLDPGISVARKKDGPSTPPKKEDD
jgi:hypothetical protein